MSATLPDDTISEAFTVIAELGLALGAAPLNKHAACWELQVDEKWHIAVNGHHENAKASTGDLVPPFNCAVTYNGWPAGLFDPRGGIICAGGCANEDTFIAALRARLEAERA